MGEPGQTTWRINHKGGVRVELNGEIILDVPERADDLTTADIPIHWDDASPRLTITRTLRYEDDLLAFNIDGRRMKTAIYQRDSLGFWRLLPPHRLYTEPPTSDEAARALWLSRFALIALAGIALGIVAPLIAWGIRVYRRRAWTNWDTRLISGLTFAGLVGLIVRCVVVYERAANDPAFYFLPPGTDNYVLMAREALANGSHIAGAFFAPGNTIYLLILTRLFGPEIWNLYLFNALLGALGIVFTGAGAWLIFNRSRTAGIAAGLVAALFPPLIFYQTTLQIAAPLSVLAPAILLAGVWSIRNNGRGWMIVGLLLGIAALFRLTAAAAFGPAYALALVLGMQSRRAALGRIALTAGVAFAVIAPQTIANFNAGQRTLINANGPETLYWGNNRDGDGANWIGEAWYLVSVQDGDYIRATHDDLMNDPVRAASLLLRKFGLLLGNTDIANNVDYAAQGPGASNLLAVLDMRGLWATSALLFLGLAGIGGGLLRRESRNPALWLLAWALLLLVLGTIAFTVFGRMRAPLWPLLCVGTGGLVDDLIARRFSRAHLIAALMAVVVIVAAWGFKNHLPRKAFQSGQIPAHINAEARDFDDLRLLGHDLLEADARPGGYVYLRLYWQIIAHPNEPHTLRIRIIDDETSAETGTHEYIIGHITYPPRGTHEWPEDVWLAENYSFPISPDAGANIMILLEMDGISAPLFTLPLAAID